MIAIGNNEKCPYCDTIITEDMDVMKHFINAHFMKMINSLFPEEEEKE